MAPLGPWGSLRENRHVAVAVSGGADSLALAWLARRWGQITAITVDHGLRPEAAGEAHAIADLMNTWDVHAVTLRLSGLAPGPALAARARTARHHALQIACRDAGLPDLLLGHHAGDQAETLAMRRERGSGHAGLAGMAAVAERTHARLLRPLLGTAPGRLKATLRQAGLAWSEDPTNSDAHTGRGRVRQLQADPDGIGDAVREALATADMEGARRIAQDSEIARALASCSIHPSGYALIPDRPIMPEALAALLRSVAGADYAPPLARVAALARNLKPATLGGCRISAAGRAGAGWLVTREVAAMAPAAVSGTWDGRYRTNSQAGPLLGPLGPDAAQLRRQSPLPAAVLETLPAFRISGVVANVPHVAPSIPGVHDERLTVEPDCCPPVGAPFGVRA